MHTKMSEINVLRTSLTDNAINSPNQFIIFKSALFTKTVRKLFSIHFPAGNENHQVCNFWKGSISSTLRLYRGKEGLVVKKATSCVFQRKFNIFENQP